MLCAERLAVDLRRLELLEVLRAAELRGLLLELQLGDLVAQRLQALLVVRRCSSAACSCAQVVVVAAPAPPAAARARA